MASVNPINLNELAGTAGLASLVSQVDKLVSLPSIYYRLEEAIVDPATRTDDIAELLRSDPDLCARMLRVANSAFYSFHTKIETIERAVSTIGLRQIRELVLITSVVKAFEGIPPGLVNMATFWEHSIAVAVMARALGEQARIPNADTFYIPGLLHDIGRLAMYLKMPGLMHDLLLQRQIQGQSMYALEKQLLGYTHADIGERLLDSWKVPASISAPIARHHDPGEGGEYAPVACAIHVADAWVNTNRLGSTGSCYLLELDHDALAALRIDAENLHHIGLAAGEQTQQVLRQFQAH